MTTQKSTNTAIDIVRLARDKSRPHGKDFLREVLTGFFELHGDRRYGDDGAIIGGVGYLGDVPVTAIAIDKGADTAERQKRNFGMPNPEGYRKALRLMKQAEKFGRPIICFVDTSGAFCGIGAEERGQGQAIAENLLEMSALRVPIITILTGEGGSGGALALSVANEVYMLANTVYSVISPEGCASILFKDSSKAPEAAEALRLTAKDLLGFGVIEGIIDEGEGLMDRIRELLTKRIGELSGKDNLAQARYDRFRKF